MELNDILTKYNRIGIVGLPKCGKTTLSKQITDRPTIHADDFLELPWEDQSPAIKTACEASGTKWVGEGMALTRSLRKGLVVDAVILISRSPFEAIPPGALTYGRQCEKIFNEWRKANPTIPVIEVD